VLEIVDRMDERELLTEKEAWQLLERMRVKAILPNVPRVTACIAKVLKSEGLDEHALYQVQLAVDEACANVVDHAYVGLEAGEMEVSCYRYDDAFLIVRVRDWGQGFDPAQVDEPDVYAPLEERSLGGLGLFLVRKVMDWVQLTFDPVAGNELLMVKRLDVAE
jgi:anti-sigma regulatory factor (Ser/Thr protein kinase)